LLAYAVGAYAPYPLGGSRPTALRLALSAMLRPGDTLARYRRQLETGTGTSAALLALVAGPLLALEGLFVSFALLGARWSILRATLAAIAAGAVSWAIDPPQPVADHGEPEPRNHYAGLLEDIVAPS